MSDSIILSASSEETNYYAQKNYGVYRASSEFRKQGLSSQVVQFFNLFDDNTIIQIIDKFADGIKILGFSTLFWEHYDDVSKKNLIRKTNLVIDHVREKYPDTVIIAGGPSCRIFLQKSWRKIDAIFEGFSENDFVPFIRSVKYGEPKNIPAKYENDIPIYNRISGQFNFQNSFTEYTQNDIISPTDVPTLEVGRGCIFKCKFCGFALNGKKKFDYLKDYDTLQKELISNYENYGLTNYILSDDTFNDSPHKVEMLHSLFTKLPFKLRFSCYLRLDLLLRFPQEIKQLKEMGLIGAFFGIESFNREAAKLIGKGIDPNVAKNALQELKKGYWGNEVKIGIGLITGLPYETYDSIEKTKDWIADESNLVDQVVPFPLSVSNPENVRPQPWDSEFQKNASKYGFTWPDGHSYKWHNSIGPVHTRDEAEQIFKDYREVVKQTNRQKQGGFNLLKAYPLIASQPNAPDIQELLNMDRHTYTKFIRNVENSDAITNHINNYKGKILDVKII